MSGEETTENTEQPTTSAPTPSEDATPKTDDPHHPQHHHHQQQQQQPEKRGEDADRYAASVAEVAAGGGGGKKDGAPGVPGASAPAPGAPPAPSPAPGPPTGPPGPPMHHQVPPNSFAPPPGMMEWRGEHQMPPGYYPPYGMPPRHHPGYPPPPPHAYYGPQGAYGYPPPHMMRPPVMAPGEMVRMPPGPTPTEWAAQQQAARAPAPAQTAKEQGPNGNPATPSSVSQPCPSPSASSIAEESMDGKPPGTKMPQEQGPPQHQMMSPMPPHTPGGPPPPQTSNSASATPVTPADVPKVSGKVLSKAELLDKLVGPVTHHNPIHVMHERRVFFERLIEFCERNGDPITMVPQVSKQSIDLHRLYIGVRGKGGFQAVTKEKYWKNLCTEANPDLAESSAAGYQLRKHYQRHLLMLECMETGRNPEDEVAFADKMKRQRKREPAAGSGAAAAAAVAAAAAAQQEKPTAPASAPGAAAPPAAYPGNGQGPPGAPQPPPGAPPPGAFPPHMDPNYHYYQQHGMMPPHPGYHPQHMNAFSPGAQYPGHQRPPGPPGAPGAPPAVPPGAQPMRAPMPQHMQQHEMDEQQRQWYAQQHAHQQALAAHHHAQQQAAAAAAAQAQAQAAQAPPTPAAPQAPAPSTTPAPAQAPAPAPTSGANTQPATPSASNQPPTPAATATLQVESTSQAGSRAPSTGPAPSATPDSTSRLSAGADAPSETPTPTGEAGSSTPAAMPSSTTPAPPAAPEAPSTSAAPTPSGPPGPPQGAPPQGYPYPYPPPPGAMRPPTGFAPPPGAPYGYPPGAPPPPGAYHPSHPQHPQHAQYMAWQQQRYHQQQQAAAAAAAQGQGPPGGPRGPYPGYPGGPPPPGAMPPQRMPPGAPQGAPSPVPPGGPPGGKGAPRYGTPAAPPQNRPGGPQAPQPLAATLPLPPQPSTSAQPPSAPTPGGYLASTLATPGAPPQAPPPQQQMAGPQQQQQHQYPQGSVEAITTAQCHVKRRKVYARELINATPRRLVMALRSGLDAEAIWSINALNVLLYDDTNPQPSLQQMPGLLNVIVEHLYATLSILFPEEFPLAEPGKPVILEESKELVEKLIGHGKDQNGSIRTMIERMPVVPRKGSDKTATFTMQSRNGLQVHFRDESLPAALRKRITREHTDKEPVVDQSITSAYVRERNAVGLGGGIAERLAVRLRDKILHEKTRPRPVFSKYLTDDDEEDEQKSKEEDDVQVKLEPVDSEEQELQTRGARPEELSDCKHEVELAWPRPTALSPKSHAMEELAHRALSLSNILRGFSFVPGSDALMARNEALLFILGRFLKLNVTERKISTKRPGVVLDADELKKEPQELSVEEKRAKERAVLDNVDATLTQMVETSGQLRDDAFVMLTHMSVSLNLFELPDTIAYPIYDGLLSWAVSRVPEATDATAPIPVSPRDYSLEIMCKMVVIERNVDMFLSTGKWSRVEQFVHILSRLLTMNEETHYREFAIVILNALCIASEAVCYICAMETSSIAHLILFIDSADQNMHQVMQAHGMNALRDNPELMGTSVGMLRRAASMLRLLVKVPKAYRIFLKHQTRLLQFTMSQLMDSRVAGMVADTLFEIQEYVKEFGEEVPEPLKITYSEGYRPEEEEVVRKDGVEDQKQQQQQDEENSRSSSRPSTSSASPKDNGSVDDEEEVTATTSSATVPAAPEDDHQNEEEKKETTVDEGESCDGYESSSSLKMSSQKRTATAELIDEQSRSPPPAKRTCLTNGFDKSKSSVSANGSLSEASQNDGALTTAVA